ncbi:MAG: hypothetical protein ACI31M_02835 [Bacilli bacterium]
MKDIMMIEKEYFCPICGKEIKKVKISKEYIRCFNKNKTGYQLQYTCNCHEKIQEIVNWNNKVKEDFSEINILNYFSNASNLAFEQALKNVGIEREE